VTDLRLRGKAFLLDFVCGLFVPSVVAQAVAGRVLISGVPISSEVVAGAFVVLSALIYWILVPYVSKGQTMGKWFFGVRIVSSVSEDLSICQLIVRTICYAITALEVAKTHRFETKEQGVLLHDARSRTRVILAH